MSDREQFEQAIKTASGCNRPNSSDYFTGEFNLTVFAECLTRNQQAKIDALELDAKRYRWLRGSFINPNGELRVACGANIGFGIKRYLDIALDEAIDKEIANDTTNN
jgi:hypothetical protein